MADFFLPMLAFGPLVGGFSLGRESHAPYHVWVDARAWSGSNGDGRGGSAAGRCASARDAEIRFT